MKPQTITIPALAGGSSGVYPVPISGKYFKCTSTSGPFRVITSHGEEYDFTENNTGFGDSSSTTFGKLTFYNDGGTAVTLTFYASTSPISIPDVSATIQATVNTALTNTLAACAAANNNDFAIVTTAAAAKAFQAVSTPFRKCTILAYQAFGAAGSDPTANVGVVYIGVSVNHQPIKLNPGDVWTFEAPTGAKFDFVNFFVSSVNIGDGVLVIYS